MSNSYVPEERKIEFFDDVTEFLSEEELFNVNLVKSILTIDEKSTEKIFEMLEMSKKDPIFIYEMLERIMSIRPKKIKSLFQVFRLIAQKHGLKGFLPTNDALQKLILINKLIDPVEGLDNIDDVKEEDIMNIYPKGSILGAIKDDDVDLFLDISTKVGFNPKRDDDELSYLQLMAEYGSSNCFKRAYSSGMFPKEDLVEYAIIGGNYEIIQLLRDEKPDCYDGCFKLSIKYHHYEISDWLMRNYNCESVSQTTCSYYYNFLALYFFEKNGIDVPPANFNNDILDAVSYDDIESVVYLVEKCGVDINQKYEDQESLIFQAVNSDFEIIRYLVEKGADIEHDGTELDESLLISLSKMGSFNICRFLIDCGADINKKDSNGNTPLSQAAEYNTLEYVKYLVENGAKVNLEGAKNPLSGAAGYNDLCVLQYLIDIGGNVNEDQDYKNSPLHIASFNNYYDTALTLLENGANIEQQDHNGDTPLFIATINGDCLTYFKFLVEKGANLNHKNSKKLTLLHYASENNALKIAKYLIENGADVNAKSIEEKTPLNYADSDEMKELLIKNGAKE